MNRAPVPPPASSPRPRAAAARALGLVALAASACSLSQNGVTPPGDTFFYPTSAIMNPTDTAGQWLYVIETGHDAIVRVPLESPEGAVEPVAGGLARMPDGMAFDAEGGLWVATFAGDAIYRVDPDGTVEQVAYDDRAITLNRPANVAFGGEDFDRLFVANLGGSFISVLDAGVAGLPLWGGLRGFGVAA